MKKINLILAAVAVLVMAGCEKNDPPQPDDYDNLIVYGKIYTAKVDESKSKDNPARYVMAEAMVVKDGKFVYVGSRADADKLKTPNSRVIDSGNKGIIIPGITDGHAHYLIKFINEQMKDNTLQFTTEQTYDDVLKQVRQFVDNARKEGRQLEYVYGEGYDCAQMREDGKDCRNRKDLDAISTEIPIFLTGFDHHSTLVNTRAMINAGILDEDGKIIRNHIAGGFMFRDQNGELNGVFAERATSLLQGPGLKDKMRPSSSQILQGIENMQQYLLSVGITNIIEGWTNNYSADDESIFLALTTMDRDNDLHLNVSLTYEIEPWFNDNNPFCYVDNAASVQKRYQSKHVHPDYLKLFMDGCVETGTGFLLEKYSDTPADSGVNYPFLCMQVAVTGAYEASTYSWQPEELIDRYQFLQAMTYNGAWQLHLEQERGSIEVGKFADFVILDENVLTCEATLLSDVKVLNTFFEGQEVYRRK